MKNIFYLMLIVSLLLSSTVQASKSDTFLQVEPGWNLISIPAKVLDGRKSVLFPTSTSSAYMYQTGYKIKDTLDNGIGYWIKFNSSQSIPIAGDVVLFDTVEVRSGWNLIGSLSVPIAVDSIRSEPADIIVSLFRDYKPGVGYQAVDTLWPGKGYWVKVNQNGLIILASDTVSTIIPEYTQILTDSTYISNLIGISSDSTQFIFSSSLDSTYNFQINDIIVITHDDGMLKIITDIDRTNNQIIITTADASLSEAIQRGTGTFTEQLTVEEIDAVEYLLPGVVIDTTMLKDNGEKAIIFSIDAVLYDHDGNLNTTDDQIKTTGTFEIGPTVRGRVELDNFNLKKLELEYEFVEKLSQSLDMALLNLNILEFEKKLATIKFHTFTIMVGGVPVIIRPILTIKAGIDISINSSITTGIYQEYTYTTGLRYENNTWSTYANKNSSFNYTPPTLNSSFNAKFYLKPELEFKIYGTLSPYLYGELYGLFNADITANPWWQLYGGLDLGAGVRMKIFKKTLFDFYGPLIQLQLIVAQASGGFNLPPPRPILLSPTSGATNQSTSPLLSWNTSSSATSYTLQVSTSSSFTSYVYNQSGLTSTSQQVSGLSNSTAYYWRVSATNSYGTSGWSTPTWSFTTTATTGTPCPGIPTVIYAGKTYNTVQIGSQCWLKENLDVGTRIDGIQEQTNNSTIEKYCYNNDPNNCNTYGGLYQWNEAMQYVTTPGAQGICPTGWHIPTNSEYEVLRQYANNEAKKILAVGQTSNATNETGFSALLAGYRSINGTFNNLGYYTSFWSSTESNVNSAYYLMLWYGFSYITLHDYPKSGGISVRCLKD